MHLNQGQAGWCGLSSMNRGLQKQAIGTKPPEGILKHGALAPWMTPKSDTQYGGPINANYSTPLAWSNLVHYETASQKSISRNWDAQQERADAQWTWRCPAGAWQEIMEAGPICSAQWILAEEQKLSSANQPVWESIMIPINMGKTFQGSADPLCISVNMFQWH